jgi:hypothetical protein
MQSSDADIDKLRASVDELKSLAGRMLDDDRYATDDEFCEAADTIYKKAMNLNSLLEQRSTQLLSNPTLPLAKLNEGLDRSVNQLSGVIESVNTTTQVIGAVGTLISLLAPLGL